MRPLDTSEKADETYFRLLSQLSLAERVNIGVELWTAGDATLRAGIRQQYPGASDDEVNFEVGVRRFGVELAKKACRRS